MVTPAHKCQVCGEKIDALGVLCKIITCRVCWLRGWGQRDGKAVWSK